MDTLVSIHIDMPAWSEGIKADDFVVAIGKTKSNTVYHVAQVRKVPRPAQRANRFYLKCMKSDLLTAIQREDGQRLITLSWHPRMKKGT